MSNLLRATGTVYPGFICWFLICLKFWSRPGRDSYQGLNQPLSALITKQKAHQRTNRAIYYNNRKSTIPLTFQSAKSVRNLGESSEVASWSSKNDIVLNTVLYSLEFVIANDWVARERFWSGLSWPYIPRDQQLDIHTVTLQQLAAVSLTFSECNEFHRMWYFCIAKEYLHGSAWLWQ